MPVLSSSTAMLLTAGPSTSSRSMSYSSTISPWKCWVILLSSRSLTVNGNTVLAAGCVCDPKLHPAWDQEGEEAETKSTWGEDTMGIGKMEEGKGNKKKSGAVEGDGKTRLHTQKGHGQERFQTWSQTLDLLPPGERHSSATSEIVSFVVRTLSTSAILPFTCTSLCTSFPKSCADLRIEVCFVDVNSSVERSSRVHRCNCVSRQACLDC